MTAAAAPQDGSRTVPPASGAPLDWRHLLRLTDAVGLFEHADHLEPRTEHGYCVDDVARGLVLVAREPAPPPPVAAAGRRYLDFVLAAQTAGGRFHNRRAHLGGWTDTPSVEDCWGRALWALGTVVARSDDATGGAALRAFTSGARNRSPHLRAMAYAGLGAAEVLSAHPRHASARRLLRDAAALVDTPSMRAALTDAGAPGAWPWPEPRLRYANAVLPEVLLAAGSALGRPRWRADGLALLSWFVGVETSVRSGHLSVSPVTGWSVGQDRPAFDQQPIEVAALAEACARAGAATGEPRWGAVLERCADWFDGDNDLGRPLADPDSGGGRDGLHADRVNENQGAESTLALLSVRQLHRASLAA